MRFDPLLEPISDDHPCGPDLDAEGDDAYLDYYYEALARIPERFLTNGQPFDRKDIDLKTEVKEIATLLDRSRDLRLLVLEAKFQALGGNIVGVSECIQACNTLTETFWEDVHPRIVDGDVTERRNQFELLDDLSTVVMPLEHAPLLRDRRLDMITYRDFLVASGKKDAREGENPADAGSIQGALKTSENAAEVDKIFAALSAAQAAIKAIDLRSKTCAQPFAPQTDNIEKILADMIAFILEARPDLTSDDAAQDDAQIADQGDAAVEDDGPALVQGGPPVAVGPIGNHGEARAALEAVEGYFARVEPSSPGLLLIRQARLLIGKPLIVALETLLPEVAEQARIDFGSETGFRMTVGRMRMLSEDTGNADVTESDTPPANPMQAENRDQAAALISNVEAFFRQTEPSSPVPILLFKAKTFLNRDFSAIINDLFAHVQQGS
ncbi:ImpA family type VI secretion system protein [Actibacterium sp. 188UL27-1]|uniref:type VI secretion system protein TssA n=1 Tax=Actibacterium sp. 188UL27-1 TaxID=2786961 RepID=UPI001956F7D6|nr:type VI secretion system ImpA family N-terminal domain-containing protein [Actibacterium sp. 188UL27-1]MBM7068830.1 type VI secretion system ImpA family N-terminal domain-containing protein [Actibacterium sp. 188UL27-1]